MPESLHDSLPALAVVGLSLKFPEDAVSPDAFWNMIMEGRCASKEFPADRLNIEAFYNPDPNRMDSVSNRGGHFMTEDSSLFDAPFFSITAAEAVAMDPQQRLTLETSYRAVESAGLTMEQLARSKTCVFTGASSNDYQVIQTRDRLDASKFCATGTGGNMLSNRVSWFFNLLGPSATVDTACSSSLVAIDLACKSIWSGDATMGIAMGVNSIVSVETTLSLSNLGLLSPDSRCYSFDDRGNGFARGEGIGAIVIRPLEDAVRNGDPIRAVIRSSASNQDGKTPGITMPSMEMQEQLIRDTYRKGRLDMNLTRYFEAHGTGTAVGDPIESKAIGSVFRSVRSAEEPLYIGSVKSNIGHLEGGSGIAGVMKTILALEKGVIPPNSENFERLNRRIDAEFLNIKVAKKPVPWPTDGLRRASVSSFGFGGTNSHIVFDDALNYLKSRNLLGNHNTVESPVLHQSEKDGSVKIATINENVPPKLLVWSTRDEKGIQRLQETWKPFLSEFPSTEKAGLLHDLAYTLGNRRTHHPWKTFAVAGSADDWTLLADKFAPAQKSRASPNMAMVFSGQGAQWFAMGREMLQYTPLFLRSLKAASHYLTSIGCEWNLLDEFQKSQAESRVNKPEFSQTMCTALQVGLVDCLRAWNIVPHSVVGHSSGEIAAAYSANAITRESAWKIAYQRGRLSSRLEKSSSRSGSMLAVALSVKDVAPYLDAVTHEHKDGSVNVACVNSPTSVTVSGYEVLIDVLKEQFDEANIFARKLKVGVGYHSAQMQEIADEYEEALGVLEKPSAIHKPSPQMVSSVTGDWIDSKSLRASHYWVRNMVSPVLFSDALSKICSGPSTDPTKKLDYSHRRRKPIHHLVEVGPHAVLQGACKDILKSLGKELSYYSILVRNVSAAETALSAVGNLHCAGYPVDLSSVNMDSLRPPPRTLANLPEYSFDHSKSYWRESLESKGLRHPRFGRNDLLGTPNPLWNPLEAHWRHRIKISEIPWVADHKVNGSIVYPGMGMLVMAIEAAKQLAEPGKAISGFNIRDTSFSAAVRIPSNTGSVETGFFMRPVQDAASKSPSWFNFRLCSYDGDNWIECCAGSIQIVYSPTDSSPSQEDERISKELLAAQVKAYSDLERKTTPPMDNAAIYDFTSRCGLAYGEAFQMISNLSFHRDDDYKVVGQVRRGEKGNETLHPTTLDGIVQTALWTLSKSGTQVFPTVVPRRLEKMWISHEKLAQGAQSELLRTYCTRTDDPHHGIIGHVRAFGDTLQDVFVDVTGLQMNVVSDTTTEDVEEDISQAQRCHQLEWKPDPQLLTNQQVLKLCNDSMPDNYELGDFFTETAFVIFARVLKTLSELRKQEYNPPQPHLRKYLEWMIEQERRLHDSEVVFAHEPWTSRFNDPAFIQHAEERISKVNARGYVAANVSRHLPQLLNGELDPLTFLFGGTQLKDFYFESLYDTVGVHRFGAYLDILSNHNNALRVIEVGAGTGSITDILMRSLGRTDDESSERRYSQWDFTDISRSFFGEAQDLFKAEGDRVKFNALDIEKDPAEQGFECGTYDVVVASLVLHATHDLKKTLTNSRKLLKPGGKLVLNELVAPDILRTSFIFGLLEGWWLSSESYRKFGPCVETSQWNDLLQQTGFSGVDLSLQDYDDPRCWECSILAATAVEENQDETCESEFEIYYSKHSLRQTETAKMLESHYQPLTEKPVSCLPIEDVPEEVSSAPTLRIFLLDLERPTLHEMEPQLFFTLQHLFCSAIDLLWINSGGGFSSSNPHYRVADGLFRAVTAEDDRKKCYMLSLDPRSGGSQHLVYQTTKVINSLLRATTIKQIIDTEYVEDQGILHIPRLVASPSVNKDISSRTAGWHTKVQSFKCGVPLQLDSANSNLLRGFKFIEDELAHQPLAADEMEVQVKCSGVNFRDVLIAVGQLNSPHTGFECSGVVTRTGEACKRFRVGDSVALLNQGCFSSFIRVRETGAVVKIGRNVSFSDAAAVPVNFATAFIAIHDVARMRAKESILIHAAAGGTGQAAIQIAQNLGAEVFATVGSQHKKEFLMEFYNIPESHIFSSRSTLFTPAIKERTHGCGVDVIFNSLAGESLKESWECIAPYGRFLEIGIKDILANDRLPMAKFLHNVSFSAINLASMMNDRPDVCANALEDVFRMISEGKLQPARDVQLYGIGDMESAFRTMQGGKHIGKIVIEMRKDDQVTTVLETHPSTSLDANGTYIISGGLGGLGRTIATWLVDRGARNLLLLSRSGARSPKAAELLQELSAKGASVMIPRCDVSDSDSVARALSECRERMPPFKGCIQAAMVLRDSSFESMSHQSWQEVVFPKVQGTWNLHQQLPSGMEFFVMLSSVAGVIGGRGQANYAAGNTFQDALARHRVALGEKATSLDLGVIGFTGAVVEDAKLAEKFMNHSPFILITEPEMHALLDMYCDPRADPYTTTTCQNIVRLAPRLDNITAEIQSAIERPLFRRLRPYKGPGSNNGSAAESANVAAMLGEAQSLAEASAAVTQALTAKLSKALSIAMPDLDANKPLHQYGVDSLVAVELRSWFTKEIQADIAVFDILGSSTISSIGHLATSKSKLKAVSSAAGPAPSPAPATRPAGHQVSLAAMVHLGDMGPGSHFEFLLRRS
ncbi:polyketide synthase module [Aspergillus affinis]|uniref:polyketide synthase module n=1 Tax=Aspergillus affinis TaxID=1070780 RepID=UPI0022FEF62B|nr:polyketide synthase module [Aspergillus affinis]KAI9046007.1 polyketide synthase module [Aspergillus affinis]